VTSPGSHDSPEYASFSGTPLGRNPGAANWTQTPGRLFAFVNAGNMLADGLAFQAVFASMTPVAGTLRKVLMASFSVISRRVGRVHFLTPLGRLDFDTASILQRQFDAVERGNAAIIVVNLSRLTTLDAAGIDLLLQIGEVCSGDGRLRVINGSGPIGREVDMAGVRDRLPIVATGTPDPAPI
jgi:anti-anti-sigma factor